VIDFRAISKNLWREGLVGGPRKARFFKLFLCHFSGDAETSFIVLRVEKLAVQRELTPTELPERRIKAASPEKS